MPPTAGAADPRPPAGRPPTGRLARALGALAERLAGRTGWALPAIASWFTALVGGLLAVGATALAAEVYDAVVEQDGVAGLDQPALREAIAWRTPTRDHVVTLLTDLGGPTWLPVLTVVVVALMVWRRRSWTPVLLMAIGTAGSLAMTSVGKAVIGRARPDHGLAVPPLETSPSFPSGHTLNTTVIVAVVCYLLLRHQHTRLLRWLTVVVGAVWAGVIGLTRVFLGHHWLTDVMAGWALGLAWAAVVVTAHRVYAATRASLPAGPTALTPAGSSSGPASTPRPPG